MTSEPGSFARQTIVERKPQLIRQAIADNDYPPHIVQTLEDFKVEIASQPIRPLSEEAADVADWNRELDALRGRTWLEMPWYLAETYFYRRLLEAVGYFQPGRWHGHDPFEKQKQAQQELALQHLADGWSQLANVEPHAAFEALLHSSLWGNRADLSNYTVRLQVHTGLSARQEQDNILIDNTDNVRRLLTSGAKRVDFINDNVGLELLFDLTLADFMLDQQWVRKIVLHLKNWPFFVSDAMPKDVRTTIALLQTSPDPQVRQLGIRLHEHLDARRLALQDHPFWTSSLMFFEMPVPLQATLAHADLVIIKGDVNYRRLLGDRHWPHTTAMEEAAAYFPAPFLVLRTLKGEIMVGLESGQAEALAAEDPTWLINGKRGIIQLVTGPSADWQ
jgi:uncharacterized protein with ATP-grasp and redox domains